MVDPFWLPSMGEGSVLPSGDPSLPMLLAGEFAQRQAQENGDTLARIAMLTGEFERSFRNVLREARDLSTQTGNVAQAVVSRAEQTGVVATPEAPTVPGQAGPPAGEQDGPPPSTHSKQPPPEGLPSGAPDPEAPEPVFKRRYAEARESAEKMSMTAIARKVSGAGSQYLSERATTVSEEPTEFGTAYVERDADMNEVRRTSPWDLDYEQQRDQMQRTGVRRGAMISTLGRFASGQGVGGALGAFAGKVAGPIGFAVGGANLAASQLEKQTQAAAPYRAIYGEQDTGMFAAQERTGQWMEGLRGFGTIGRERAEAQYQAASELGLRGDEREQATDFSSEMYKRLGMETGDSMRAVEMTVRNSNLSLSDFADKILEVSEAAVAAGRNSSEAIRQFVDTTAFVQSNITTGGGGLEVAAGIEAVREQLPQRLQNDATGQMLAGMVNSPNINMVAAQGGMDRRELLTAVRTGDVDATLSVLRASGELIVEQVAGTAGITGAELRRTTRDLIGDAATATEAQQREILLSTGIDPENISTILRQYGANLPPAEEIGMFFEMVLGALDVETQSQQERSGPSARLSYRKASGDAGEAQRDKLLGRLGYTVQTGMGNLTGQSIPEPGQQVGDSDAFSAYSSQVNETGVGSRAVERLLSQENREKVEDLGGVEDAGDAIYQVSEDGKTKRVSLTDIIANPKYLAQLNSGTASILKGGRAEEAVSVSEITGIQRGGPGMSGDGRGGREGQWAGGEFTLSLTPEAKRLFSVTGPSPSQRRGEPEPGSQYPGTYANFGGG